MSDQDGPDPPTPSHKPASSTSEGSTLTPSSTPSDTPNRTPVPLSQFRDMSSAEMEEQKKEQAQAQQPEAEQPKPAETDEPAKAATEEQDAEKVAKTPTPKKKATCRRKQLSKDGKSKTAAGKSKTKDESSSSDSSDDETSSSDSSSSESEDESEDEPVKKKSKSKRSKKSKKASKRRKQDESDADDSNDEESEDEPRKKKSKKSKKSSKDKKKKRSKKESDSDASASGSGSGSDGSDDEGDLQAQLDALKLQIAQQGKRKRRQSTSSGSKSSKDKKKGKKASSVPSYQRVDQLWDSDSHDYKLKESAEADESEFAEHAFLVRRCFNWENRYTDTVVDIKSKQLRTVLSDVLVNCKSVTLEAEEPTIDPNTLFLYLEELRTHYKKTLKAKIKSTKKQKTIKKLTYQKAACKLLVKYIDEDYAAVKKTLYPLLEAGNITFDLLWALYKPNEIAITSCYGSWEQPRCFKVDYANKFSTMSRGEWYCIEGRYLEYDGKSFGFADFESDVESFKGPRKINSLGTYPLKYHRDLDAVKKKMIERGEQFVDMPGMQYKAMKGMAFMKKRKQVAKININGRVMVDPSTFRRVQPNYAVGGIRVNDTEELYTEDEGSDSECGCCGSDDEEGGSGEQKGLQQFNVGDSAPKFKYKWVDDKEGRTHYVRVEVDENGDEIRANRVEKLAQVDGKHSFTEEELLLASPVVLGFAFSEKLWLEFSISGLHDIVWNESAFDSLVLPPNQKQIVRALVESHKSYGAKAIDDVVVGKGQALNCVLHGPPGTGKTLTAESISELLHCPLYMVSAGELGVDPGKLEYTLQQILDIAHSWGAILLIDEADVFLEARELHDLQRNALVSIFLRLLEYYQGILILTTNRVNTFDDAFQSRIHIALRYGDLSKAARLSVWKMFIEMVHKNEGADALPISASDLESLSRHSLNGRQIKNLVKSAQSLALYEKKSMGMEHIRRVLDVAETFDRDLKGGTGYLDAMRSYT